VLPASEIRRVHITGGPDSGKTTLARALGAALRAPVFDLDGMTFEFGADNMAEVLPKTVVGDSWVSAGAYGKSALPLFEHADLVVCLDIPWRVASYRILSRHIKAELSRNNPFPGWKRLYRFWLRSSRYYRNRNSPDLDSFNRAFAAKSLEAYANKFVVCRTNREIDGLVARLTASAVSLD